MPQPKNLRFSSRTNHINSLAKIKTNIMKRTLIILTLISFTCVSYSQQNPAQVIPKTKKTHIAQEGHPIQKDQPKEVTPVLTDEEQALKLYDQEHNPLGAITQREAEVDNKHTSGPEDTQRGYIEKIVENAEAMALEKDDLQELQSQEQSQEQSQRLSGFWWLIFPLAGVLALFLYMKTLTSQKKDA